MRPTNSMAGGVASAVAALLLFSSVIAAYGAIVTTTVFVNRHFEIRDHDQPTKYVFNGETRVADVIGSFSSNARVQRLRVYPGWNLCSLAVTGPFPASGAEALSAGYTWNSGTGAYTPLSLGQTLSAGTILWLKARTNGVVSVAGTYSDPTARQVQAGGNYVPGAGLETWTPMLPGSGAGWNFDAATSHWLDHLAGDLASVSGALPTLAPGAAFYLEAADQGTLEMPHSGLRIRYYHQDHLGSSSVVTDAGGALVQENAFFPFGCARNQYQLSAADEPYRFTQKEQDRESGLVYLESRYLAGSLARFNLPDLKYACPDRLSDAELAAYLSAPQQLNLYSYVRNNPIQYTDPSGQDPAKPKTQSPPETTGTEVTLTFGDGTEISVPVTSVQLGTTRAQAGGGSNESADFTQAGSHKLVITKPVDASSVTLKSMAFGNRAGTVDGEITFSQTRGGHSEVYMRYKLTSVLIADYSLSGHGPDQPVETVTLYASEIEPAHSAVNAEKIPFLSPSYYLFAPEPSAMFGPYADPQQAVSSTGKRAETPAANSGGTCYLEEPSCPMSAFPGE